MTHDESHTQMTKAQRIARRDELIASGSLFATPETCGEDRVPCGICDECIDNGVLDAATP